MKFWSKSPKRVYLDYAAATPLLPEAKAAMEPFLNGNYANASAIHTEGIQARQAVEKARLDIARVLGVRENEVYFTGSGTESNNLAILGLVKAQISQGKKYSDIEVITTRLEHPSVLKVAERLTELGATVHYLEVDTFGLIELASLRTFLNEKTALVTFAYANSEIGVIQPVKQISRLVSKFNQDHKTNIRIHLDAAQAPLWLNCEPHRLGVDLVTVDAGKCNGPKGVGVLVKLSATEVRGVTLGGGQEDGLRAGTENVAGIVGSSVAIANAQKGFETRAQTLASVRDQAIEYIQAEISTVVLNGPTGQDRLANNINISIPGLDTEFATVVLDRHGFAVSTKSACAGAGGGASAVVREISNDLARATSTLRISLSPETKLSDLKRLTKVLKEHIETMAKY